MPPKKRAALANVTSKASYKVPKIIQFPLNSNTFVNKRQIQELANSPDGGRILWEAVDAGVVALACILIQAGADLTFRDPKDNCTVLHQVAKTLSIENDSKRKELVRLLIEHGADVNAQNKQGCSVLHYAIVYSTCSSWLVEQLLESGANVNFGNSSCFDDIATAAYYKPNLLMKFIKQVDEGARTSISIYALRELIIYNVGSDAVFHSMKDILNLGTPVNILCEAPAHPRNLNFSPLLSIALSCENKNATKLLLEYGANPHQKNNEGCTPLYQATAFEECTHASRWLIEKGACVHAFNDDGRCPIHGACLHNSLNNIHLFLNLGADLNVTDNKERTPFSYTGDTYEFNEARSLVIKHLCLIVARGRSISNDDIARANEYFLSADHFKKCTEQLERMKVEMVYDDLSYFTVLSENIWKMIQLMGNPSFVRNFKQNNKKFEMFPEYYYMLLHEFEVAKMRYNTLLKEKIYVQEGFNGLMPDYIVVKIAYYLCYEKLKQCQYNFYMSLHESLEDNQISKENIQ